MRFLAALFISLWLGVGAQAAVAVDAVTTADIPFNAGATTCTGTPITVGAGATALLAVIVFSDGTPVPTTLTVKWGVTSMSAITGADTGTFTDSAGNSDRVVFFGLASPASGAQTFTATWTNGTNGYCNVMSFTGTDTTTPFKNGTTASGTSTTASVTVTSPTNDMAVGAFATSAAITDPTNQTKWWVDNSGNAGDGAGNYTAGAGSTVLSGGLGASSIWQYAAVDVQVPTGAATCPITRTLTGVGC